MAAVLHTDLPAEFQCQIYFTGIDSRRCRRLAVLVPVLLHGTYDFIATYEYDGYAWIFVVFVVLLFAAAYRRIKKLSRDDRFIDDSDYYHYDGPEF